MQIGRRIYYDLSTGNVVQDLGERQGSVYVTTVEEDFNTFPSLIGLPIESVGIIELTYGERYNEFLNMGSYHVDPATETLIIYPRLIVTQDKSTIQADGVDTATLTVNTAGNEVVTFRVDGMDYLQNPTDGACSFSINSDLPGTIQVEIITEKYGRSTIKIEVI